MWRAPATSTKTATTTCFYAMRTVGWSSGWLSRTEAFLPTLRQLRGSTRLARGGHRRLQQRRTRRLAAAPRRRLAGRVAGTSKWAAFPPTVLPPPGCTQRGLSWESATTTATATKMYCCGTTMADLDPVGIRRLHL